MSLPFNIALIALTICASTAVAADIPDSGRLLRESTPPPAVAPHQQLPDIQKPVEQKEPKSQAPSGIKVKVSSFTFTGNTVLPSTELSALLAGYVGKELTLDELNGAAAQITAAYRTRGYFLASALIPPQTIKTDAPIVIEIIEGILEGVRLETVPPQTRTPKQLLKNYIDRVPTGKPAEEEALSAMVMRINEIPGISSRIVLEPGSSTGTTKALLTVKEGKPYNISVDTDNHGNYSTGYYRIGSTLELYSPLHLGDLFTLRAQTSTSGDTQSFQTGYSLPVSGSGTKVGFNYSYVTYQLGGSFKTLDADGDAHNFTLSVTQPVIRSRSLILNLSLAGEEKILDDRTGSAGLKKQRHTTAAQLGVNGVEMDSWLGGGSTSFSLTYFGGYLSFDDGVSKTYDQSALGLHTDGGYNKLVMSVSRNQTLYKNVSFYTSANGQWASTNLDSAEQFSLGGPNSVRAFSASEASCDKGLVTSAELRYLFETLGPVPGSLQAAAFVDYGHAVISEDPIIASANTRNLTGIGFGLSWFEPKGLSFRASAAWQTAGTSTGKSSIEQPTVYFQVMKRFM